MDMQRIDKLNAQFFLLVLIEMCVLGHYVYPGCGSVCC